MTTDMMLDQIKAHVTVVNVTLFLLLLTSEVMGTSEKFKNSSIFALAQSILMSLRDKVFGKPRT